MKKSKEISNRSILWTAIIGSLFVIFMVNVFSLWRVKRTNDSTDEAISNVNSFYLETMAEQRARTMGNEIDNYFIQMEKAVGFLEEERIGSEEELREMIGKLKTLLGLERLALADQENTVYTQYTTYTGKSRHSFLSQEKMEERFISTVSLYGSSLQLCLAVPTPNLIIMGKPIKACFIHIDMDEIVTLLAPDEKGRTYFAVYSKNGANLSRSELGPAISDQNFFSALEDLLPETEWDTHFENFQRNIKGSITFSSGDVKETMCYVPIPGPGWELAVSIRESVIMDQIRSITEKNLSASRIQISFTFVSVLLLAVVLLLQLRSLARARLEEEKKNSEAFEHLANTDCMTGVQNKHAYFDHEAMLNQLIEEKKLSKLAVVICDINGLKYVNDTLGHAAGDELIVEAAKLICDHFAEESVFRIGGDEFAVLIQDKGYEEMIRTIEGLNRMMEENVNRSSLVIAIGYSTLKPMDKTVNDVFIRSDRMMYARKKELKAMGANTR